MKDAYDNPAKSHAIEWLSEMGFDFSKARVVSETKPASDIQEEEMNLLHTTGAITVCLLLLGYCVGVVLFPNLGY